MAAKRTIAGKRVGARRPVKAPAQPSAEVLARAQELAWTGQHGKAIELCTHALAGGGDAAVQMSLLDVRAESQIALGKLDLAAKDAGVMLKLAAGEGPPEL